MSELFIEPKSYKQHADIFDQMPDGVQIVVEYDGPDDWYIERVEGGSPEAKHWITFIEEWIGCDWNEILDRHAWKAIEYAVADWGADRADYEYETWRDGMVETGGLAPGMTRFMHK